MSICFTSRFFFFQSFSAAFNTLCKRLCTVTSYERAILKGNTCKIFKFNCSIRLDRVKMKDFWEEYSNELEDDEFRRYYRMDKSTFMALTSFINPQKRQYQGGRIQVRPHKMVAMTLFFLGSKLPFWQMSGLFGVSEECFIRITDYVMALLVAKIKEIIKWPSKDEYAHISSKFNRSERKPFPNVISAIDGCHIRISANENEKNAYRNYKRYHSIHLQAVCSFDCKFIDVFVG